MGLKNLLNKLLGRQELLDVIAKQHQELKRQDIIIEGFESKLMHQELDINKAKLRNLAVRNDALNGIQEAMDEIERLHKEIKRLNIDRDQALAYKPDLGEYVKTYNIKPGDLVVFRHTRTNGQQINSNSFGFGLSAVDNLKKELERLVGGPVMVIGYHAESTFEVNQLDTEMQVKLMRELEAALQRVPRDTVNPKKKIVSIEEIADEFTASRRLRASSEMLNEPEIPEATLRAIRKLNED